METIVPINSRCNSTTWTGGGVVRQELKKVNKKTVESNNRSGIRLQEYLCAINRFTP